MHLSPAQYAIRCFGGAIALSRAIGAHEPAPYQWLAARKRYAVPRALPGDIPVCHIRRIVLVAAQRGYDLTERDMIFGRDVPDPEPMQAPELSAT